MDKDALLDQIEKSVKNCQKCRLYKLAKNGVPGEGNRNSPIIFIGEAPGATEDAMGRPFVGRAGKLLEVLLKEIGYTREDVWIGNIIKHRPPENRDPLPDEITACVPYLETQLKAIAPKLIVTLGRFSLSFFYKDGRITKDHGRPIKMREYVIFPVYHPAAALRNPEFEAALREDFKKIPIVLKEISEKNTFESDRIEQPDVPEGQLGLGF